MSSQNDTPRPTTRELSRQVRKLEKQVANLKIKLAEERSEKRRALRPKPAAQPVRVTRAEQKAALRENMLASSPHPAAPAQPLEQQWFEHHTPEARLAAIDAKMTREQPLATSRPR